MVWNNLWCVVVVMKERKRVTVRPEILRESEGRTRAGLAKGSCRVNSCPMTGKRSDHAVELAIVLLAQRLVGVGNQLALLYAVLVSHALPLFPIPSSNIVHQRLASLDEIATDKHLVANKRHADSMPTLQARRQSTPAARRSRGSPMNSNIIDVDPPHSPEAPRDVKGVAIDFDLQHRRIA